MTHPADFYIAHRLYTFRRLHKSVTEWGSFTDGPEDRQHVLDLVADWQHEGGEHTPALTTLRVWHFQADVPARDVTEDILAEAMAQIQEAAA
jgi:hypothetical protein